MTTTPPTKHNDTPVTPAVEGQTVQAVGLVPMASETTIERALEHRTSRVPAPDVLQTILALAPTMHACRFYKVASPEQAAAVMLVGYELGFGLTGAFEYIHVIENKPSLSPRGALAVVHASGELADWKMSELPDGFACWMKRRNGREYGLTFTLDDAKKADLIKAGGNWEKWPKQMLKWRCIGFVVDVLFPDLLGGLKRSDEYGATVNDAGDVLVAQS